MYKGPADWTLIGEVKNNPRMRIPIFGNGDIDSPMKAVEMRQRYGVDGVMIGRASIGYPWIFREIRHYLNTGEMLAGPTIDERVANCRTHLQKSVEWKGERLGVVEMRKHYANYFKGLDHFRDYRIRLVTLDHLDELHAVLDVIRERYELVNVRP